MSSRKRTARGAPPPPKSKPKRKTKAYQAAARPKKHPADRRPVRSLGTPPSVRQDTLPAAPPPPARPTAFPVVGACGEALAVLAAGVAPEAAPPSVDPPPAESPAAPAPAPSAPDPDDSGNPVPGPPGNPTGEEDGSSTAGA